MIYNQFEFNGVNPSEEGLKQARETLNNYLKDVDKVGVEVFESGKVVDYNEYTKRKILNEDFYYTIRDIVAKLDGNAEVCISGVVTAIKKELEKKKELYE